MIYIDQRNWPEYNAQLVRRGEFYLDLQCVKNWNSELRKMNRKKSGAPFKYPNAFIFFVAVIYSFLRMPYRQIEGFIGKISKYEPGLVAADYTTLFRRISKLALQVKRCVGGPRCKQAEHARRRRIKTEPGRLIRP